MSKDLVDILRYGFRNIPCKYRPKFDGPFLQGTIVGFTSRNVIIENTNGIRLSAPFDQVYIDERLEITIPANLPEP